MYELKGVCFLQNVVSLCLEEVERLSLLCDRLQECIGIEEKLACLHREERVIKGVLQRTYTSLEEEYLCCVLLAIGQEEILQAEVLQAKELDDLLSHVRNVEQFYAELGGVVGYQLTLLQLLAQSKRRFSIKNSIYHAPKGLDLVRGGAEVHEAIYHAIVRMEELAEIYPIGGAADRLNLHDADTGALLPAALLSFKGKPMLEGLIEDLQAREYLYYQLLHKQITLPIVVMTSHEKQNHQRIVHLLEQKQWFFRPKESFAFLCQPLVPVVTRDGKWVLTGPGRLLLKPGGHGVVWKLARDLGVFTWLQEQGVTKAIVRQINNPIASEDYGLLAFSGYGLKEHKKLGFASCERQVKACEGVNVLVEETCAEGVRYTLTNIEYCDFAMYGLQDEPMHTGYAKFPSNTNVLFVDLASITQALKVCPIPGVLANVKKTCFMTHEGELCEREVARLESTMQNIADCFSCVTQQSASETICRDLDTYITFNVRRKTIAATKKEYFVGGSLLETPEGCFLESLENIRELLQEHCHFSIPLWNAHHDDFMNPPCLFSYHPALGPLYAIIGQKIRKGRLARGSEVQLFLAECDIEELDVEGSLLVTAESVMGHVDEQGCLRYSSQVGRCQLHNVRIRNQGIDFSAPNVFWRREIWRKESVSIILKGQAEFVACDLEICGHQEYIIEDGFRGTLQRQGDELILVKERINKPSWRWDYAFAPDKTIRLLRR